VFRNTWRPLDPVPWCWATYSFGKDHVSSRFCGLLFLLSSASTYSPRLLWANYEVEILAICHGILRGVSGDNDKRPMTTLSPSGPRSSKMSLIGLWTAQDSTLARRSNTGHSIAGRNYYFSPLAESSSLAFLANCVLLVELLRGLLHLSSGLHPEKWTQYIREDADIQAASSGPRSEPAWSKGSQRQVSRKSFGLFSWLRKGSRCTNLRPF
jgi:hypothetical protein